MRVADRRALLRRKVSKSLEPFAEMLLLLRRQLFPLLEPLSCVGTLVRIHV